MLSSIYMSNLAMMEITREHKPGHASLFDYLHGVKPDQHQKILQLRHLLCFRQDSLISLVKREKKQKNLSLDSYIFL